MEAYSAAFSDVGRVEWSPYTVYFHPRNYSSPVVNTDRLGFRIAHDQHGAAVSVANAPATPVNLLAGSSTAFGIGASADDATLASLLATAGRTGETWLNLGGRSFNAIQEYILGALHQHMLPKVNEIVVLSGFNNLGLARQPTRFLGEHGTFFMRSRYDEVTQPHQRVPRGLRRAAPRSRDTAIEETLDLDAQIEFALETTQRALTLWASLAQLLGARLTFVLQPLANWVREVGSQEETEIFDELDRVGGFTDAYGDILDDDVRRRFSSGLANNAREIGLQYLDGVELFRKSLTPGTWAFVDRIHFTDAGHRIFADALVGAL